MFKVVIGRKAKMHCMDEVGKEMGVNTWAAFAGSNENSLIDGDFVVLESELQRCSKLCVLPVSTSWRFTIT
jgi:hypothetical protein